MILLHLAGIEGLVADVDGEGGEDADQEGKEGERRNDKAIVAVLVVDYGKDLSQCVIIS